MGTPKPRLSREETALLEPPRKVLQPHEIKMQMYLRECKKLQVIPVGAYLRQPTQNALIIRHYNMGPNGARALAAPLLLDQVLSFLDIEGNSITPIGLASIQEALSENIHITQLNIADNKLGTKGAQLIGLLMSTNATIERLNVSHNGFRDSDAIIFAKIMKQNRHLKELILAGNEFGDIAGPAFGKVLANNESLEIFDVSWNHIRKQSAAEFAQGIKENVALKSLNVSFNGFGTEGTSMMAQAIAQNRTLQHLDMSKNRITDIDITVFNRQLKCNDTLKTLRLGDNLLTTAGATDIIKNVLECEANGLELIDLGSTSVDLFFIRTLDQLFAAKDIKVIFGKIQKTGDIKEKETAFSIKLEEGDEFTEVGTEYTGEDIDSARELRDKSKTYILDEDGNETGVALEGITDKDDDKKMDDEVEAVTGRGSNEQIPVYAESTGTLTPDI